MHTEYDDNLLDYWKLAKGNYTLKLKKDDGLDGDNDVKDTKPSHLRSFFLDNSQKFMKNFVREIGDFYNSNLYYGDTESICIGKKVLNFDGQSQFSGWRNYAKLKTTKNTEVVFTGCS